MASRPEKTGGLCLLQQLAPAATVDCRTRRCPGRSVGAGHRQPVRQRSRRDGARGKLSIQNENVLVNSQYCTGLGMTEQVRERAFEPFLRLRGRTKARAWAFNRVRDRAAAPNAKRAASALALVTELYEVSVER